MSPQALLGRLGGGLGARFGSSEAPETTQGPVEPRLGGRESPEADEAQAMSRQFVGVRLGP